MTTFIEPQYDMIPVLDNVIFQLRYLKSKPHYQALILITIDDIYRNMYFYLEVIFLEIRHYGSLGILQYSTMHWLYGTNNAYWWHKYTAVITVHRMNDGYENTLICFRIIANK